MILSYRAKTNEDFPEDDKVYYTASVSWYPTAAVSSKSSPQIHRSGDSCEIQCGLNVGIVICCLFCFLL